MVRGNISENGRAALLPKERRKANVRIESDDIRGLDAT